MSNNQGHGTSGWNVYFHVRKDDNTYIITLSIVYARELNCVVLHLYVYAICK